MSRHTASRRIRYVVAEAVLGAALFAWAAAAALAAGPPKLDIGPSCDAAARGAVVEGRDKQACLGDEQAARDTLTKNWTSMRPPIARNASA